MCPTIMEVEENKPKTLDKSVLDLFYKLANENTQNRIDACVGILRFLSDKQTKEDEKDELHKDLKYCLERLIKGLASPRGAARLGFSLLLTEILKKFTIIEIEDVLELVKQHLSFTLKQEKRDVVFGLVFAYSCLVRSHRLANHSHLSFIFLNMFDLWQGKNYIVNACYEIIKDLFDQLSPACFKEKIWPHLKEKFSDGWEKCTSDTLWLLLLCNRMFPDIANEKYLKKRFDNRDLLSADNFEYLKKFIRQTTSCLPKLHPLCSEILICCQNRKNLKEVWISLVDDNLFEGDQTEKSFVGFEMVKFILQDMKKKKIVKAVLSPKFRAVFARSYVNMKSPINSATTQLAVYLSNFAKDSEDFDVQMIILKFFLQPPGNISLDQLLKKKEISLLIQNLLPDTVKIYCEFLKDIALKKNTDKDDNDVNITDNQRLIAVTQIGNLVSHAKIMTDIDWRISVIKFLFLHSFFAIKEVTTDILHCDQDIGEIPAKLRESFVNAFFKTLTSLYQRVDQQTSPIQHSLHCLMLLVDYTDQLLSDSVHLNPLFSLEQVQKPWHKVKKTIHKLEKQSTKDGKTNESNAFLALFLELGFHVFQDSSIADVLEELRGCVSAAVSNRSSQQPEDENEPPWILLVTDIMLSLLSKSSHHLRRLVTSVFHLLCPFITQEALELILNVIHPQKSKEDPMLVEESDEENLNFESGSSSDESDYNDPENYKVDEKFRLKVKEALGSAADASDAESVVLSDSEMFKLDDALSLAFRERAKTGHTKMTSEDKTMLDFRLRCLDLVTTYLKSEPPLQLVLQCIEPLLAAYEFSHRSEQQNHLLFKIVTTIETMTRIKKFQHYENVGRSDLKKILEMLVEKCHKEVNANVANKLYSLCVFVVFCFRRLESHKSPEKKSNKTPSYLKIYLSALENFVKGSSNIFPQFFVSLMQSYPDTAWNIMEKFKDYAFDSNIRMYKQTQCLGLLSEAIKYAKAQIQINTDEWATICQIVVPAVANSMKQSLSQSAAIKPVYFTELLEVLCACHSISEERTKTLILGEHPDLLPLLEQLSNQGQKRLSKKSRRLLRIVIQKLGGKIDSKKDKKTPVTATQPPAAEPSTDTTNSIEKSPKKRKSTSLEKKKKKFKTAHTGENVKAELVSEFENLPV